MQLAWQSVDEQDGDYDLTWEYGPYTVNATQYDNGEWVIRYSTDGGMPTELYSRGVFTRDAALVEAKACMRDLSLEYVETSDELVSDQ